ncbi:hypothetical protein EDD18DRAFT_1157027 [Armillaria luteobubalina]|uniref:Uncharacterized protein n=1 Tax=Armillaria luteobubalina TaxID=153913 RepID=A0AA39QB56_9AGAR|nr:hypothetical protein EDD18DRAFT_1157027 [Armillaria luteobubalina]
MWLILWAVPAMTESRDLNLEGITRSIVKCDFFQEGRQVRRVSSQNRLEVTEGGGGLGIKSNRGKNELWNPEVYLRQGNQKIGVP